jgi:hypothetical protein
MIHKGEITPAVIRSGSFVGGSPIPTTSITFTRNGCPRMRREASLLETLPTEKGIKESLIRDMAK